MSKLGHQAVLPQRQRLDALPGPQKAAPRQPHASRARPAAPATGHPRNRRQTATMGTKDVLPKHIVDAHMYDAIYASMEHSLQDAQIREAKYQKGEVIRKKE